LEECKICGHESTRIFEQKILNKYLISYYQCPHCGFSQTEKPFWLNESYDESMNLGDTGQMKRTLNNLIKTKNLIRNTLNPDGKFLDFAGGYGLFARGMRDLGYNFFWDDLYTPNILCKGFEKGDIKSFDAITVFECFEHFEHPIDEIKNLFSLTDTIIFTTSLISVPAPKNWWYYGFDHGQHISLFSEKSLKHLESKLNCHFYSKFGLHVLTKKRISPIILWLCMFRSKVELLMLGLNNIKSLTASDHTKLIERKIN
jgi:hypothetical protein